MADTSQIAYAAGFFDGEGWVGFGGSGKSKLWRALKIEIAQKDPRPLRAFQDAVGGRGIISLQERTNKHHYRWRARSGVEAAEVLELLLPYLIGKRDVAELGLEYQKTKNRKRFPKNGRALTAEVVEIREDIMDRVSKLNQAS